MKIAIVGCGAVGSYYGARLSRAGHEVHALLRSDYEAVRQNGIEVRSVEGDFRAHPIAARRPEEIGPSEAVFIALKTTANGILRELMPPLIERSTMVVSLENGLGDEEQISKVVGAERVLGGLCFVCLNRLAPGVISHTAHGLIVLGEHLRSPLPRTEALADHLRQGGIPCRVAPDLARAHWEKLVWNIPFNGLGVAGAAGFESVLEGIWRPGSVLGPVLPTDRLLADSRWEQLVRELMAEVLAVARAEGHEIDPSFAEEQIERTRVMGAYRASTLLDFEQGRPLEVDSMFSEPCRRARRAGAPTPRLAALCRVLEALDAKARRST